MHHNILHHLFIAFRSIVLNLILLTLWFLVGLAGYFFWNEFDSPLNLLLGMPLSLIGITMSLISFYEMLVSLISWRWGKDHCPFCGSSGEVSEILNIKQK